MPDWSHPDPYWLRGAHGIELFAQGVQAGNMILAGQQIRQQMNRSAEEFKYKLHGLQAEDSILDAKTAEAHMALDASIAEAGRKKQDLTSGELPKWLGMSWEDRMNAETPVPKSLWGMDVVQKQRQADASLSLTKMQRDISLETAQARMLQMEKSLELQRQQGDIKQQEAEIKRKELELKVQQLQEQIRKNQELEGYRGRIAGIREEQAEMGRYKTIGNSLVYIGDDGMPVKLFEQDKPFTELDQARLMSHLPSLKAAAMTDPTLAPIYTNVVNKLKQPTGSVQPSVVEKRVMVISPEGKRGSVPESQLGEAIAQGYRRAD